MATQTAGQAISSRIGLTLIGTSALSVGDAVEITANYTVDAPTARASIKMVGTVSKANSAAGGDVAVEARGSMVRTMVAGATVSVGAVVVDANGKVQNYDAAYPGGGDSAAAIVGLALNGGVADANIDVLWF